MKLTYEMIKEKALKASKHPKFAEKAESVCSMSGMELLKVEDFAKNEKDFIKQLEDSGPVLLLDPSDLLDNGTACGGTNNKCFSTKVVNYLKKKKVSEIFVGVMHIEEERGYLITGGEMKISEANAEKLADLIYDDGGSWRPDVGTEDGWSSFESE